MPYRSPPGCAISASSAVERSNARAVYALSWEISIEPSHAPSWRTNAVRLFPASTTAMFIGTPSSVAFSSAAWTTVFACLRVSDAMRLTVPGHSTNQQRPADALRPSAVCPEKPAPAGEDLCGTPHVGRDLDYQLELGSLRVKGDRVALGVGAKAALRGERQALERDVSGGVLDPGLELVGRLQV